MTAVAGALPGEVDLTYSAGADTASFTFDIQAVSDAVAEASEQFQIALSPPVVSSDVDLTVINDTVTTTIEDATTAVTLDLTQSQGTITEGGSAALYTVALSPAEALTACQSITKTLSITQTGADPA